MIIKGLFPTASACRTIFVAACAASCVAACEPPAEDALQVVLVLPPAGLGDSSFADSAFEGAWSARLTSDFDLQWESPDDVADVVDLINKWLGNDWRPEARDDRLAILVGTPATDMPAAVDCDLRGLMTVALDVADVGCADAASVDFSTFAPSFLAGVAAMNVSATGTAAVIAGQDIEPVNRMIRGFTAGVEYAGGTVLGVEYLGDGSGGFNDPEKAHDAALRWYEKTDIVFPVAGGSGLGVIAAAKEAEGRYTIGVDADQSQLGPGVVIGSVLKRLDLVVRQRIEDAVAGRFEKGPVRVGMRDEAVVFLANDLFADSIGQAVRQATAAALEAEEADQ